ncbi:MAG: hypothetical protein GY856_54590 [bacterium]|nr:hypothetical protein [bacterium]
MLFSCYSAGTPEQANFGDSTLGRLRRIAPKPFVSSLSKKLLRCGALAVLGHIDRAWTTTFSWKVEGDQTRVLYHTLKRLLKCLPVGYAMEYINQQYAELSVELSGRWEDQNNLVEQSQREFDRLWQATNDARNWVVIGDPAVRLMANDN